MDRDRVASRGKHIVTNRHVANDSRCAAARDSPPDGRTERSGVLDFLQEIGSDTLVSSWSGRCTSRPPRVLTSRCSRSRSSSGEREARSADRLANKPRCTNEHRGHRLSGLRQPHSRTRSHGANLRQDLRQEATGARRRHQGRSDRACCTTARRWAAIRGPSLVDLDSGEALGLHFSGTFLTTNYAVRSDVVKRHPRRRSSRPARARAKLRSVRGPASGGPDASLGTSSRSRPAAARASRFRSR